MMVEKTVGSVSGRRSEVVGCQWGQLSPRPCRRAPTTRVQIAESYGGGFAWYCDDHVGHPAVCEAVWGHPEREERPHRVPRPERVVRDRHIRELVAEGKSLEEVGRIYGLTRQRVSQIASSSSSGGPTEGHPK